MLDVFVIVFGSALALTGWFWLRRSLRARGIGVQPRPREVWILGQYSPLLTWLRYQSFSQDYWRNGWQSWRSQFGSFRWNSLLPRRPRLLPNAPPAPAVIPPSLPDDYGPLTATMLLYMLLFAASGQYLLLTQPSAPERGWIATALSVLFFLALTKLRVHGAVPARLTAIAARLGARPAQLLLALPAPALAAAAYEFAGPGMKALNPAMALALWGAAIMLSLIAAYRHTGAAISLAPPWSRAEVAAVLALGAGALLLRQINNTFIPAAWTGDEGSAALIGVEFLTGQRDNLFSLGWYSFPSLYFLIPAAAIGLGGNDYGALRTPSAIAGALTVVGLYWLARPMFGRGTAILAALLLGTLGYHIHFSRIGLQNVWDGLFAVIVFGAFWRGWYTGRRIWFMVAGLTLGLAQYFYISTRMLPLVLLGWLALTLLFQRETLRQRLADVFWLALIAIVVVAPLASFYFHHPEEYAAPVNRVMLDSNWLAREAEQVGQPVWRVAWNNAYASALAFTAVPLRAWYNTGKPMLLEVSAPLFIVGVLLLLTMLRDPRAWLLGLWLAGVIASGALTESTPAGQRYVVAAPAATLVTAFGLSTLGRWASEAWPAIRRWVYAMLGLIVAAAMAREVHFYFMEYIPNLGRGDPNTEIATLLADHLADQPSGSVVYFFGPPHMGYYGFSTHPFLAPQVTGYDVFEPLTEPPTWPITGRTFFVFLPHRDRERALVEAAYPGGNLQQFYERNGQPLFWLYTIEGPR
ncbi:MAG: glycosyltransferase family 39 protein [Anaerolineales bacterium]|nr:glycosyltransferase family 39 protein [Anaerolineales bacterium]